MRMTEAKATAGCFFLASTKVVVHDSWKLQYVQRLHRKEDPWLLNSTSSSSRKVMSVPRNSYTCTCACMHAKSLQSCLTLGDPMNCSLPGSFVHGISQARTLEWVAISFSRGSSQPRDQIWVSCIVGSFFTTEPPGKPSNFLALSKSFIFLSFSFLLCKLKHTANIMPENTVI